MWNYSHREFQILPLEPLRARSTKNLDPFIVGVLDPLFGSLMGKKTSLMNFVIPKFSKSARTA